MPKVADFVTLSVWFVRSVFLPFWSYTVVYKPSLVVLIRPTPLFAVTFTLPVLVGSYTSIEPVLFELFPLVLPEEDVPHAAA